MSAFITHLSVGERIGERSAGFPGWFPVGEHDRLFVGRQGVGASAGLETRIGSSMSPTKYAPTLSTWGKVCSLVVIAKL